MTAYRSVMIDEPSPFDTQATWERHLAKLRDLPADTDPVIRDAMIAYAEQMIEDKRMTGR
jgi:hypothetical protein